ncbi:hypothetical protein [Streptomyces sp. NBC_01197]|uniref:hypothetical protein n=1 Tax=Streptomyces sp. NBC_01197 TaxID=2903768 RepID=UPI002E150F53|nr:hypothetical protein OG452_34325 [Streptomyces sp. NBC_01197]
MSATLGGCSSAVSSDGKHVTISASPSRSYLHPVNDVYWVKNTCQSGESSSARITFWLHDHAAHGMAYDIRYEFLDESGQVIGSAYGIFSLAANQVLGDEALFGSTGRCGPKFRLAYVNAYDSTADGADRPHF